VRVLAGWLAPGRHLSTDACRWPPRPVLREPPLSSRRISSRQAARSTFLARNRKRRAAAHGQAGPGNPISTSWLAICDFVKPGGVGFRKGRFRGFGRPRRRWPVTGATRLAILAGVKRPMCPWRITRSVRAVGGRGGSFRQIGKDLLFFFWSGASVCRRFASLGCVGN